MPSGVNELYIGERRNGYNLVGASVIHKLSFFVLYTKLTPFSPIISQKYIH